MSEILKLEMSTSGVDKQAIHLAATAYDLLRRGETKLAYAKLHLKLGGGEAAYNSTANRAWSLLRTSRQNLRWLGDLLRDAGYEAGSLVQCGAVVVEVQAAPLPARIAGPVAPSDDEAEPTHSDRDELSERQREYAEMTRSER